jgi:hypothetical protein
LFNQDDWLFLVLCAFLTLLKYIAWNVDNHMDMANSKVIALVSGNIETVSGPAAQDRSGIHEWIVWEGTAIDKAGLCACWSW